MNEGRSLYRVSGVIGRKGFGFFDDFVEFGCFISFLLFLIGEKWIFVLFKIELFLVYKICS